MDEAFTARARTEILEELGARRSGGGGIGGTPFTGPIVANEAAAAAFPLSDVPNDVAQIFVLSHRSIWTKRNGVAGTQGVPPLAPHEVIAVTAGPAGVLCRTMYSDPALRVGINDIFIDPANVLANDENDGLTAGTPLKTGQELFRRWGWGAPVIVGPNLVTSPDGFTTVHIQSDLVSPDQLEMNVIVATNGSMRFRGNTPTLIHAGVLTDAVTAMNRAAPLGGTRLTLRDNTLVNWAIAETANRRVRMVNGTAGPTGAHNGGTFQPQTDSLVAPGGVQCSACQATNEPGFSTTPITLTPTVGDTYNIEALTKCNFGFFQVQQQNNANFGGFQSFINFVDLNFPAAGPQLWAPINGGSVFSSAQLNFYQCTFDRTIDLTQAGTFNLVACYFFAVGVQNYSSAEPSVLNGGGMNGVAPGFGSIFWNARNTGATIDGDFVANNSVVSLASDTNVRNFASWNGHALAGVNTAGHGVVVGLLGVGGIRGRTVFHGTLWGNSNGGVGLLIGAACKGLGAPQNITGTQGDGKLANNASVGGNNVYWQAASGLFVGATGAAGVASDFTWALVTAAKAAPGYGGSVHFPDQDASFIALETTA